MIYLFNISLLLLVKFCLLALAIFVIGFFVYVNYTRGKINAHNIKNNANKIVEMEELYQKTFETSVRMLDELTTSNNQHSEMFNKINKTLMSNYRMLTQIQIVEMIKNHPDEVEDIKEMYENYLSVGGNGYLTEMYDDWKTSLNKKS